MDATDGTTGPLRPAFFYADGACSSLYAYALTRIVGYPRHEVRNEDRLPRAAFDLLAVALAQRGT